jgi:hypothetical protein
MHQQHTNNAHNDDATQLTRYTSTNTRCELRSAELTSPTEAIVPWSLLPLPPLQTALLIWLPVKHIQPQG